MVDATQRAARRPDAPVVVSTPTGAPPHLAPARGSNRLPRVSAKQYVVAKSSLLGGPVLTGDARLEPPSASRGKPRAVRLTASSGRARARSPRLARGLAGSPAVTGPPSLVAGVSPCLPPASRRSVTVEPCDDGDAEETPRRRRDITSLDVVPGQSLSLLDGRLTLLVPSLSYSSLRVCTVWPLSVTHYTIFNSVPGLLRF